MEPPPDGTVTEPLLEVERPLVETQAYCLPEPALTGSDHEKLWDGVCCAGEDCC
jgi:hypothetical protein